MRDLGTALQTLQPASFWKGTKWLPITALAFGVAVILLSSAFSQVVLMAFIALLLAALVFGFLARSEVAMLCGILAGFVVIVRYAEGFQLEEIVYGLAYLGYLGYWFISRTFFYRDTYLRTAVDWALLLFLIYVTLSILLTPLLGGSMAMALSEWTSLSMLAFYFPIKEVCIRHRDRLPQKPILLILGGIALFVAMRNVLDYRRGLSEADYLWQLASGRVVMNEHMLMMAGLVVLVFLLYASEWRRRSGLALLFLVYSVGVIIGQSRAVWVSFLLGVVVIFFFVERRQQIQLAVISFVGLVSILAVGYFFFEETFRLIAAGLVDRFFSLMDAATEDVSLINRFVEMGAAWESIQQNPIVGHGLGVKYKYYSLVFEFTRESSYVHNGYVGVLYRHGLLGFCMLGTFYVGSIWHSFRTVRRLKGGDLYRLVGVAAMAFLIAEALVANAANPFTNADTTLIIGSMAGLAAASYHEVRQSPSLPPSADG